MRVSKFWIGLALGPLLAACSTQYDIEKRAAAAADPIAAYKRSQPTAPPAPPFRDFGFVEGDTLTLQFTPGLVSLQARQVCEQKPIERVMTRPNRVRRCLKRHQTSHGCIEWETARGEPQPPCEKTWPLNASVCVAREDPNEPKLTYRYAQDCYATPAPPDVLGRVGVYAVPGGTRSAGGGSGRLLWSGSLPEDGKPQTIRLADAVRPGECLALADGGGQAIPVRDGGGGDQSFATPHLLAASSLAQLQAKSDREQQTANRRRNELESARQAVLQSVAWKDNRCTVPAMRPLPPEPTGVLPAPEIAANAAGYCVTTLAAQIDAEMIGEALRAAEEHEYRMQFARMRGDSINAARCTWKSYEFDPLVVSMLRGGSEAVSQIGGFDRLPSSAAELFALIGLQVRSNTMNKQQKNAAIIGMLRQCTRAATSACEGPRSAWRAEISRVQSEPQQALQQCESKVQSFQQASAALKIAEQSAAEATAALQAVSLAAAPGRLRLSEAACRTQ